MNVTKGDTPAAPILVLPRRDDQDVDLRLYTTATATVVQPDGTTAPTTATIDLEEPAVAIDLPTLDQAGLVGLQLQLAGGGGLDTFDVEAVVVQDLDGWHTLASARAEWAGAEHITDPRLYTLLRAARSACVAFKPEAGTRRPIPDELEAQLLQARNRYAGSRIDPASGDDGTDSYSASAYPMDWAVKALLRPQRRFGGLR